MDESEKKKLISTVGVKGNVRYITITDNVPEHWDSIISIAKSSYSWFAYIFHDKDSKDGESVEKHLHILCYDEGGTSLKAHCARFESVIPSNFVCKVFSPRAMARYLIHKDNPQKYQYSISDIQTNGRDKLNLFLNDYNSDCVSEYRDFFHVRCGIMSVADFLDKYRGEFASMPFHHKLSVFARLMDGYNNNNNNKE